MTEDNNFKNLHLQLSEEDIKKIDSWKVSKGMKSRSEAIRSMVRLVTENDLGSNEMREDKKPFFTPENKDFNEIANLVKKLVKEELKNN